MKKVISTLFLVLLVYSWFFIFHTPPKPTPKQVLGESNNITLFIEPDSGRKPILDAINSAKYEILVEVYLLSDKEIINSLIAARSRGVAVNVILEEHPFGGGGLNPKTKTELLAKGIAVKWSNPEFALTHEKALIIDNSSVFILSQNLAESSFSKNREFDLLDKNQADVDEVRKIFLADWQRSSYAAGGDLAILESPDNSRSVLTSLINSAKSEIEIEVEVIDDREVEDALAAKAKIIPVKLILPKLSQIDSNKEAMNELTKENVKVKTLGSPYVHGKTILIDDTKAYLGSVNLTSASMDDNRELGIVVSDSVVVKELDTTFTKDWDVATIYE